MIAPENFNVAIIHDYLVGFSYYLALGEEDISLIKYFEPLTARQPPLAILKQAAVLAACFVWDEISF